MGKGRTKPSIMPIDRTGEDRPSLFVGWIDALPVPAALIRPLSRGNFSLHASNAAFDRLGLSPAGVDAPFELRRAIERATQNDGGIQEFSCRLGIGVAARDLRGSIGPLSEESGDTSLFLLTLIDRTQEMMTERNLRRELVSDSLVSPTAPASKSWSKSGATRRVRATMRSCCSTWRAFRGSTSISARWQATS